MAMGKQVESGDVIHSFKRNKDFVVTDIKFGNKYYQILMTPYDKTEAGAPWRWKLRSVYYAENTSNFKFVKKTRNAKDYQQKRNKAEQERQNKEFERAKKGREVAEKHDLQPGDMVKVNWRSGPESAQLIEIEKWKNRAVVYNSNWTVQTIPLSMIAGAVKEKPWRKLYELQEELAAKKQKRIDRRQQRK